MKVSLLENTIGRCPFWNNDKDRFIFETLKEDFTLETTNEVGLIFETTASAGLTFETSLRESFTFETTFETAPTGDFTYEDILNIKGSHAPESHRLLNITCLYSHGYFIVKEMFLVK